MSMWVGLVRRWRRNRGHCGGKRCRKILFRSAAQTLPRRVECDIMQPVGFNVGRTITYARNGCGFDATRGASKVERGAADGILGAPSLPHRAFRRVPRGATRLATARERGDVSQLGTLARTADARGGPRPAADVAAGTAQGHVPDPAPSGAVRISARPAH